MSSDHIPFSRNSAPKINDRTMIKDGALLFGWIASIIVIAAVLWFFTQPLRNSFLLRSVNKVLEQSNDSRRLQAPLPNFATGTGTWFSMVEIRDQRETGRERLSDGAKAFVFTFIGEGYFFPCAAVVASDGKVMEFIPLNSHGRRMIKRISPGVLKIYTVRIEGAVS